MGRTLPGSEWQRVQGGAGCCLQQRGSHAPVRCVWSSQQDAGETTLPEEGEQGGTERVPGWSQIRAWGRVTECLALVTSRQ